MIGDLLVYLLGALSLSYVVSSHCHNMKGKFITGESHEGMGWLLGAGCASFVIADRHGADAGMWAFIYLLICIAVLYFSGWFDKSCSD